MYNYDFRAVHYPFRLYSGKDALEKLPEEVARNRSQRAFIVCGRTVSRKTPLISRMRQSGVASLGIVTTPMLNQTLGTWAVTKGGIKKVYTMVSDYGPGHDAEQAFQRGFKDAGGDPA